MDDHLQELPGGNGGLEAGQFLSVPYFTKHASARAQCHIVVVQRHPLITHLQIPMLYVDSGIRTNDRTLEPVQLIVEYNLQHSAKSLQSRRTAARALGLLVDFVRSDVARGIIEDDGLGFDVSQRLLARFATSLMKGTTVSSPDSVDPEAVNLNWLPATSVEVANNLLDGLKEIFTFLKSHKDFISTHSAWFDALPVTPTECIRYVYSNKIRDNLSIFGDLKFGKRSAEIDLRLGAVPSAQKSARQSPTKRFPPGLLPDFINHGFILKPGSDNSPPIEDDTSKLKTLLEASFGLRGSETLHTWVSDITVVNGQPCGRMKHPCFGTDWFDGKLMSRESRLRLEFDRTPRNLLDPGGEYAGWKGVLLEKDYSVPLYLAPHHGIGELLSETLIRYISGSRRVAMEARLARGLPDHPYLLVTCSSSNPDEIGQPYTLAAARGGWRRSINRLNQFYPDREITVSKLNGTTPHGLRHLYGYSLAAIGLNERQIQLCLRHVSPLSSRVYTQPDPAEISDILNDARSPKGGSATSALQSKTLGESLDELFDFSFKKRRVSL